MLDKLSEKFLRYVINNQNDSNAIINIPTNHPDIGISSNFITDICKELEDKGYIHVIPCTDGVHSVILRKKGAAYFDNKRTLHKMFWKDLAISKASDIIVSAATTLLVSLLT